MMHRAWLIVPAAVAASSLAWMASAQNQPARPPAPAVTVQPVAYAEISPQAEFIGRVKAVDKADLRARVSGFLGPRLFTEGATVQENDVVFTIEPEPFEATVAQRKADVAAAKATLRLADDQLARARDLIKNKTISDATFDQRVADQLRAQADVQKAEAALQSAEINLSYTKIRAPITGRIGQAAITPGNLVAPESGVLATIVRVDPMYVTFTVTQRDLLTARGEGLKPEDLVVRLRLADGSIYSQTGRVDFTDVQINPSTDSLLLRARFANSDQLLYEGQTVRVLIEKDKPERALVIPQAALATDQAGSYVLVIGADNTVAQRRIQTGAVVKGQIVVTQGLAEGDKVIVEGLQRARPGMVVNPIPVPAAKS